MEKSGMKNRMIAFASVGLACLMAMMVLAPVASAATSASWEYSFLMGETRAQATVVQTANGVVWVIGGVNALAYGDLTTTSAYNPSTGNWLNVAPLPTATRGACGEVGADGRIYVMGGTASTLTQIFNITTNTWSSGTNLAVDQWEAKSAKHGTDIFVFGGSHNDQNETQIYDTVGNSWTLGTDMPYHVQAGAVVYDDNYAYYFGGQNESGSATTNVSRYSFASDSWSMLAPLPSALAGEAAAIGPDGMIYVFGGADEALNTGMGAVYADTFAYDRASNSWMTLNDMNVARAWLGAAVSDNKILALGGNTPGSIYAIVESLDTLANQLSNLQNQITLLQNELTAANNEINNLNDDLSEANNMTALLQQKIVDLNAKLNQTETDLNAALGTTNNNANNAKSAADSASMVGMIGLILGIVAILIAIVAIVMGRKK